MNTLGVFGALLRGRAGEFLIADGDDGVAAMWHGRHNGKIDKHGWLLLRASLTPNEVMMAPEFNQTRTS